VIDAVLMQRNGQWPDRSRQFERERCIDHAVTELRGTLGMNPKRRLVAETRAQHAGGMRDDEHDAGRQRVRARQSLELRVIQRDRRREHKAGAG